VFVDQAEQMRQLERCLGDDTMPLDPRVARALILLFGINISRVLRIRQDQITGRDGTYLTLDRHELIIPPRLVPAVTSGTPAGLLPGGGLPAGVTAPDACAFTLSRVSSRDARALSRGRRLCDG
jgi:hypothetical protein